jgi:hypothetical protein
MAGASDLSDKWGGYQMLVNIAKHKQDLDAMGGFKDTVTDHKTVDVLTFMDYKHDVIGFENKLHKIINKK